MSRFDELDGATVYAVPALRLAVFVVEQRCPDQHADGADAHCRHLYPRRPIRVAAQYHLQVFHESLGFRTRSAPCDEDGSLQVDMVTTGAPRSRS